MRDKIKALYYPDFWVAAPTLKKSILLFDEIHFMDRPSFTFGGGVEGSIGMVGASSPIRQYEKSFRDEGVPLYVHEAPGGLVPLDLLSTVEADLADPNFVNRFQSELRSSRHFRDLQISPGNYGSGETHETLFQKLSAIDLQHSRSALEVFNDTSVRHMDHATPEGCLKILASDAAFCSIKMSFALAVGGRQGFTPLADAKPYSQLLSAKYVRAVAGANTAVPLTDLSLAILEDLVPPQLLEKLTMSDLLRYRRESENPREAFLEHLGTLQSRSGMVGTDGDYAGLIERVIKTEIWPAAREYRNQLQNVSDKLFGRIQGAVVGWLGSSAAVQFFGDISWQKLLPLAGAAAAYAAREAIGARVEERAIRRECAISYLLDLE